MHLGRAIFIGGLCLIAILVCSWAGNLFIRQLNREVPIVTACVDSRGILVQEGVARAEDFHACLKERAERFFSLDYVETRDISKAFLTLLTAIFVASITFSEKIVNLDRADWWSRALMICCWIFLLVAISTCGTALALMMQGAGYAAYSPNTNFEVFEVDAINLYLCSGLSFGAALTCLLVAGIISLLDRKVPAQAPPAKGGIIDTVA